MIYVLCYLMLGCVTTMISFRIAKKRGFYQSGVVDSPAGEKGMVIVLVLFWLPIIVLVYFVKLTKWVKSWKPE